MRSSQVKSATAFRTISEVAADLDVPQHVLRFWETRFPQIRPLKRGGGRRYYRPEDVELLRVIQRLLYKEGYTIRGVQRLLREHRAGLLSLTGGDAGSVDSQEDTVDANALVLDDLSGELPVETPPDPVFVEPLRSFPHQPAIAPDVREELESLLAELQAMKRLLVSLH